jgi:hypothetical protein
MTTTAQNILELTRIVFDLGAEVDELRHQVRTLAAHREGLTPEQLAGAVAAQLAPQLDAVRRTATRAARRAR